MVLLGIQPGHQAVSSKLADIRERACDSFNAKTRERGFCDPIVQNTYKIVGLRYYFNQFVRKRTFFSSVIDSCHSHVIGTAGQGT